MRTFVGEMKRLVYILLGLMLVGVACRRSPHGTEAQLVAIDSLVSAQPDSALALLAGINADSLPADLRADHDMLTTQALYKAYIPASTDTLIARAWSYYRDHGPYDRRIRAMLYSGTTAEELGRPDSAMRWYKRTELESRPDDHYHRAYAQECMGTVYQTNYLFQHAIEKYRLVISNENKLTDSTIIKFCTLQLTKLYLLEHLDSVRYFLNKLEKYINSSSHDPNYERLFRENSIFYHYYNEDYLHTVELGQRAIVSDSNLVSCACWQVVSIAYAKQKNIDSAKYFFAHAPMPTNLDDSVWSFQAKSEISLLEGNLPASVEHKTNADELAGIKVFNSLKNTLFKQESKEEKEWREEQQHQDFLIKEIVIIIVATLVFLLLFIIYWYREAKKKRELRDMKQFIEQLELQAESEQQLREEYRQTKEQLESRNAEIVSIHSSMDHFTETLRTLLSTLQKPSKKNQKADNEYILKDVLSEQFFMFLRQYIDASHNLMVTDMLANQQLSEQDINIICMHLCKIPNSVIRIYAGYTNEHSVTTRKERIVKIFLGKNAKISDIMNYKERS